MPAARVGFLLGVAVLVAAVLSALSATRARRGFLPGPWRYALEIPPATRPALPRTAIEDAAADLALRVPRSVHELDPARTVAATVARGGLPTPVYRATPSAPRYVVLEDTAGGADRWRFVYDELLRGLAREGVGLERYTFAADLEHCSGLDGRSVVLGELLDHADALIVIGDGETAVDPVTGERAVWLVMLHYIPKRLWINPVPPARWSPGARAISMDTPMEHGVARALAALRTGLEQRPHLHDAYPAVIERTPATASAVIALRSILSASAFRLVAAVSAVGPPTIALARWLAEIHALQLDERDWLCVVTLPWFRTEQWPAGVVERLSAALTDDAPALSRALASSSDRLHAKSEPPRNTGAHLVWQLDAASRAAQQGQRRSAARALNRIARTPLAHQARGRLAALGLRYRARTMLILAVVAGAMLIAVTTGYGIVDTTRRSGDIARRAAEHHLEKFEGDGVQLPRPRGSSWPQPFAVRVTDGNGEPVANVHIAWSDPQLGPRTHILTTGADGLSRAPQICPSPPRSGLRQIAQLIAVWNGPSVTDQSIPTVGEPVAFTFTQLAERPSTTGAAVADPGDRLAGCTESGTVQASHHAGDQEGQILTCNDLLRQKDWQALDDCATALEALDARDLAEQLHAKVALEIQSAAKANQARQELRNGNLKAAEVSLHEIYSDSAYIAEISEAFTKAEEEESARVKASAQRLAYDHDCAGLRRYLERLSSTSTQRVMAAARAVSCAARSEPPAFCAWVDVDKITTQAATQYDAGSPDKALSMLLRALPCSQTPPLYRLATIYACSARDDASARTYSSGVAPEARTAVAKKCQAEGIDLLYCESSDVENLIATARDQYAAGFPKKALQVIERALACKQDVHMYRLTIMFACSAHDIDVANRYFPHVPSQYQGPLQQRCQQEGLELGPETYLDCEENDGTVVRQVRDASGSFLRTEPSKLKGFGARYLEPCPVLPP